MMRAALVALGLLCACAPAQEQSRAATEDASAQALPAPTPDDVAVRIHAEDAGRTVSVRVGDRFAVELIGVPTAGYVWAPVRAPAFVTRAGEASGNTTEAQSKPGFAGGNHWEVFLFAATGPGTGEIAFEQRRPWETSEPAAQTFSVTIEAR